jgi:hypothetical protein
MKTGLEVPMPHMVCKFEQTSINRPCKLVLMNDLLRCKTQNFVETQAR